MVQHADIDHTGVTGISGATIDTEDFILGAEVNIVNASTFYDGPSGSFAAGTWLIIAQTQVRVIVATSQTYGWRAKVWDGSTVYGESFVGQTIAANVNGWAYGLPMISFIVTLGSPTTLKTSVACVRGSTASVIARDETNIFNEGTHLATRLIGYRVF